MVGGRKGVVMPKVKEPNAHYATRSAETAQLLLKEIQGLPEDIMYEILNFIRAQKNKTAKLKDVRSRRFLRGKDLAHSEIVGLWSKRNIANSVYFARKLRKQAEERSQ